MFKQARRSKKADVNRRGRARLIAVVAVVAVSGVPTAQANDPLDEPLVEPMNSGGGFTMGTITYTGQYALPSVTAGCKPTTFEFNSHSLAFVFNTVISGYAGPATVRNAVGSSPCESAALGGGEITLRLEGTNATTESVLECAELKGRYTRVLSDMTLVLSGGCLVNKFGTGIVTFVARLQVVPADAKFTSPSRTASADGPFVLAPA